MLSQITNLSIRIYVKNLTFDLFPSLLFCGYWEYYQLSIFDVSFVLFSFAIDQGHLSWCLQHREGIGFTDCNAGCDGYPLETYMWMDNL